MLMSVTPMVCVTLALGLGYSGLTLTGDCCARTYGVAHIAAKRIAKLKNENRLRKIIFCHSFVGEAAVHYVTRAGLTASGREKMGVNGRPPAVREFRNSRRYGGSDKELHAMVAWGGALKTVRFYATQNVALAGE